MSELNDLVRQYHAKWGHDADLTEFPDYARDELKKRILGYILKTGESVSEGFSSYKGKIWAYVETEGYGGRRPDKVYLHTPCPICGNKVLYRKYSESAWGYECQTEGCMIETFRGL